ncbi:hypothetical protein IV102_11685 [bacterium]|nr:hypothetical protein [bacterium]
MHLLPLLLIPILIVLAFSARRWGLFADTPVDPEARLGYWASQALAHIKQEVTGSAIYAVEEQLHYGRDGVDGWLWSQSGQLWQRQGSERGRPVAEMGQGGHVSFAQDGPLLHVVVNVREGDLSRELRASLPVVG